MRIKGQGGEPGPQESPCAHGAGEFSRSRRWHERSCREKWTLPGTPGGLWRDAGSPACVEWEFVPNSTSSSKGKVTPSHTWVTVATPRSQTAARPIHHPPSWQGECSKMQKKPCYFPFLSLSGAPQRVRDQVQPPNCTWQKGPFLYGPSQSPANPASHSSQTRLHMVPELLSVTVYTSCSLFSASHPGAPSRS